MDELESRQPTIPPVRVSEVSGGERRADFRRGFSTSSSPPPPAPPGGEPSGPGPGTSLTGYFQRSSLPSLRLYLVGWAGARPLGKPVGPGPVCCPSGLCWGCWAYFPPREGPRAGLVVRTGEHVGVTGTLCVLAPVTCPPGCPPCSRTHLQPPFLPPTSWPNSVLCGEGPGVS